MAVAHLRGSGRCRPYLRGPTPLKEFLTFIGFNVVWALSGSAALSVGINPFVLIFLWLPLYVWGVAFITEGSVLRADYAVKIWLLTIGGTFGIGAIVVFVFS